MNRLWQPLRLLTAFLMHQTSWMHMTCSAKDLHSRNHTELWWKTRKAVHCTGPCWSANAFHWPGFHHRWSEPGCGAWPRSAVEILVFPARGASLPLPPAVAANNTQIRGLKGTEAFTDKPWFVFYSFSWGAEFLVAPLPTAVVRLPLSVIATKRLMPGKSQTSCSGP